MDAQDRLKPAVDRFEVHEARECEILQGPS
jgi:hypothetical protein